MGLVSKIWQGCSSMGQTACSYQSGKLTGRFLHLPQPRRGKGISLLPPNRVELDHVRCDLSLSQNLRYLTWPLQVQFRVFKETVGPLKESAVWVQEKYHPRRFPFILVYCTQTQMKTFHNLINQCTVWLSIGTRDFLVLTSNGSILI